MAFNEWFETNVFYKGERVCVYFHEDRKHVMLESADKIEASDRYPGLVGLVGAWAKSTIRESMSLQEFLDKTS